MYETLPYSRNLTLLTDLYQLTMAYGYYQNGMENKEACFNLFFRKHPFQGGFTIAAGLEYVVDFLKSFHFERDDIDYLASLTGNDGRELFSADFLDYLEQLEFSCDLDAIEEGRIVFPLEPLIRVRGPLIQCQLIETALLNIINFQSLIASKARRVCNAADGDPVLEFGLRRAQGVGASLAASRAAYIGGVAATSNVLAGKMFQIPVKGTHAHSWVMAFDDELESFQAYAKTMPNNCVFLVDTFDTLEGVQKAVEVGKSLRKQGHEMVGIRLDSGDLAYLSIEARKILDQEGFESAKIVASNDLDENIIQSLKQQGSKIAIWGVGTKLATAYDQPALGGVYKLSAIRDQGGEWLSKVKLSEQAIKVSNPGIQQVRRYYQNGQAYSDLIYDIRTNIDSGTLMIDPLDMTRQRRLSKELQFEDLLVPVFKQGNLVYKSPGLDAIREKVLKDCSNFHQGIQRLVNPHKFPVGIEKQMFALKTELILRSREGSVKEGLEQRSIQ